MALHVLYNTFLSWNECVVCLIWVQQSERPFHNVSEIKSLLCTKSSKVPHPIPSAFPDLQGPTPSAFCPLQYPSAHISSALGFTHSIPAPKLIPKHLRQVPAMKPCRTIPSAWKFFPQIYTLLPFSHFLISAQMSPYQRWFPLSFYAPPPTLYPLIIWLLSVFSF